MIGVDDGRLLVKVARLYYDEDMTQAEIAERLRLTRQKVQRMLAQARGSGIVQIKINAITGGFPHLERALEERYGLVEAVVAETTDYGNQRVVAREIGAAGAAYLLRVVRSNDRIVVSWGNSLLGVVDALAFQGKARADGVEVIQGLGGLGDPNREIHATQLVTRAARALNARAMLLPAPAVVGNRAARDALYADRYVAQTLERARAAELAFVGIGSIAPETVLAPEFWNIMTPAALADLGKRGAVGSINLRYFNAQGRTVSSKLDDCIIGLTLDELRKIRRVVAVAGGSAKLKAIETTLKARLVNVLVTDHMTAQQLLKTR